MARFPLLAAFAMIAAPAIAQPVDWTHAETVTVTLSSFDFTPQTLQLESNRPYRLHFVNAASGGHNFVARDFFRAATIAPSDRARIANGTIELRGGESADVRIMVDSPGRYAVHCSHFMHSVFGMTGAIVVR